MQRYFLLLITAFLFLSYTLASACTNILVTKGASKDGSVMITYSCDGEFVPHPQVIPAADHQPGDSLEFRIGNKIVKIPQPPHTYKVVGLMNEHQLVIGETTFSGRQELINPQGLFHYWTLMRLALQRAKTAREAIKVITDLVQKDQALIQSEARWRSLVEQAPDYIMMTDLHGKIEFVNRNFFSIPEKMVIGHIIYDLVPQSEMRKVYNAIQRVNAHGDTQRFEIQMTIDEQKRCYFIRVGPIKKSNQIVGLTFIATDITRRKKSEQELNKYRAHLQNLVSERTQKLKTANQELNHYNRLFNRELNQVLDKMSSTLQEMQALSTTASDNRLKEKVEILSAAVEHLIGQFNKIKSGNNAAEQ